MGQMVHDLPEYPPAGKPFFLQCLSQYVTDIGCVLRLFCTNVLPLQYVPDLLQKMIAWLSDWSAAGWPNLSRPTFLLASAQITLEAHTIWELIWNHIGGWAAAAEEEAAASADAAAVAGAAAAAEPPTAAAAAEATETPAAAVAQITLEAHTIWELIWNHIGGWAAAEQEAAPAAGAAEPAATAAVGVAGAAGALDAVRGSSVIPQYSQHMQQQAAAGGQPRPQYSQPRPEYSQHHPPARQYSSRVRTLYEEGVLANQQLLDAVLRNPQVRGLLGGVV
jgi:hypothetical protein